jgi:hypothetical protein
MTSFKSGRSAGTLHKKNRQFLDKSTSILYCFSETSGKPSSRFSEATARLGFGSQRQAGKGSGMAPEAIEIAQTGPRIGDPPAHGRRE